MVNMIETLSKQLAKNVLNLRKRQGLSQLQMAEKAGIPRSTLTYIESGESNPSLANLSKVAAAFNVSVEELISKPRSNVQHIKATDIPLQSKSGDQIIIAKLLPDPIPGMEIDRMTLQPGARFKGTPHISRTKEYLYCAEGTLRVYVNKTSYDLESGDLLSFPGDEPHAYQNPSSRKKSIGFSVVVFAPSGL